MSMMPIVDGLEAEFEGRMPIHRLNALEEENRALQTEYQLFGHPSFAVVDRNGEISATFFGPQDAETLRQSMQAVLGE